MTRAAIPEGATVVLTRRGRRLLRGRLRGSDAGATAEVLTHRDGSNDIEIRFHGADRTWARLSPVWVTVADVCLPAGARRAQLDAEKAQRAAIRRFKKPGAFDSFPRGEIHFTRTSMRYPDAGYTVGIRRIGKGHATEAFLAEDGWVYLFTRNDARDPAKEVLHGVVRGLQLERAAGKRPAAYHHLPAIEWLGYGSTGRRDGTAWRMPKYERVSGETARQGRVLAGCLATAHRTVHAFRVTQLPDLNAAMLTCAAAAHKRGELPFGVLAALRALDAELAPGWTFEFPRRNLMQDAQGRLILLDVIFDREAVARTWR